MNAGSKPKASLNRAAQTWTAIQTTAIVKGDPMKSLASILQKSSTPSVPVETSLHKSKGAVSQSSKADPQNQNTASESHTSELGSGSSTVQATVEGDTATDRDRMKLRPTTTVGTKHQHSSDIQNPRQSQHRGSTPSNDQKQLDISTNSLGQYIVDGQTFAPSIPITLMRNAGPVTFRILTTASDTYIAIGTSTTVPLREPEKHKEHSTGGLPALEFTRASNGDFVLHGTTLTSGKSITIGTGHSQATLRITTIDHTPAVVIDGTLTEWLGHDGPTGASISSAVFPSVTNAPPPPLESASPSASTSSTSLGSAKALSLPMQSRIWLFLVSIAAVILFLEI